MHGVSHSTCKKFPTLEEAENFAYGSSSAYSAALSGPGPLIGTAFSATGNPKIDSGADSLHWGEQFSGELTGIRPSSGYVRAANGAPCPIVGTGLHRNRIRVKIVKNFPERLMGVSALVSPSRSLLPTLPVFLPPFPMLASPASPDPGPTTCINAGTQGAATSTSMLSALVSNLATFRSQG